MRGLDPRIHLLAKRMDCRVKPVHCGSNLAFVFPHGQSTSVHAPVAIIAAIRITLRSGTPRQAQGPVICAAASSSGGRPSCGGVDRNPVARRDGLSAPTSPLMRGRGSKHHSMICRRSGTGRPSCGGVDRNLPGRRRRFATTSRPSCGGVDRNQHDQGHAARATGRPSCGGVDRNRSLSRSLTLGWMSPLMRWRGSKLR
jgi:hypothetical protein